MNNVPDTVRNVLETSPMSLDEARNLLKQCDAQGGVGDVNNFKRAMKALEQIHETPLSTERILEMCQNEIVVILNGLTNSFFWGKGRSTTRRNQDEYAEDIRKIIALAYELCPQTEWLAMLMSFERIPGGDTMKIYSANRVIEKRNFRSSFLILS